MSETLSLPVAGGPGSESVADYVRQVRAALADLPVEEVEELTTGMEADLSELAAEAPEGLRARLGSPEAYAVELRSAAGLPPAQPGRSRRSAFRAGAVTFGAGLRDSYPGVASWCSDLRPAWWVARGVCLGFVLSLVFGWRTLLPLLVLAGVVASIWLGRSRKAPEAWKRRAGLGANVLGLAAAPFVAAVALSVLVNGYGFHRQYVDNGIPSEGLVYNGTGLQQVYAYDANGKRLVNVRLFDNMGEPLQIPSSGAPNGADQWTDTSGRVWTNVYPGATGYSHGWTITDPSSAPWEPPLVIDPLVRNVGPASTEGVTSDAPTEAATPTPTTTSGATGIPTSSAPVATTSAPAVTKSSPAIGR